MMCFGNMQLMQLMQSVIPISEFETLSLNPLGSDLWESLELLDHKMMKSEKGEYAST
jgi:hypothetical protein